MPCNKQKAGACPHTHNHTHTHTHTLPFPRKRGQRGQSLIEAMIGFLVLIPIGLLVVDLVTVLSATQTNEQWADSAARAAACQGTMTGAEESAKKALERFEPSAVMNSVQVEQVQYDPVKGQVSVSTVMEVSVPVPFPVLNKLQCHAASVQPIVAIPARI